MSGSYGLFMELGPKFVLTNGEIIDNFYSWNNFMDLIIID